VITAVVVWFSTTLLATFLGMWMAMRLNRPRA
jgi:hypothetical protein